jgi:hypothetical protein
MKTAEITKGDLPMIYEDAVVLECSADEARALEVNSDELAVAIDNTQGEVFGETGKVAWLVIKIVG